MKRLLFDVGGRPLVNDDLVTLQEQLFKAIEDQYAGLGDFIISGCEVSGSGPYNVSEGLVYLGGRIRRFAGAAGIELPMAILPSAPAESDPRSYETGDLKNCMVEYPTQVMGYPGYLLTEQKIVVSTTGSYNFWRVIQERIAALQPAWIDLPPVNGYTTGNPSPAKYRKNGLGKVQLRGYVGTDAYDSNSQTFFTLPLLHRPSQPLHFVVTTYGGNSGGVAIQTDGQVKLYSFHGNGAVSCSLDGIEFDL